MKALVPLSVIANDVCVHEIGDSTKKYKMAITKWMADGFKEMHLFLSPVVSLKTTSFEPSHSISMPCDYVYETKVAMKVGDKIALLWCDYGALNKNQHPEKGSDTFNYLKAVMNGTIIPDDITPFYNYNGVNVLDAYGTGINPSGFYSVDHANGVINIGSLWPENAEILVEYKSDGVSAGLSLIPSEMVTAVKEYALWKYYRKKKDYIYREHKDEYLTQYFMLKELYTFRPLDYLARIYQNTPRQTINNLM